MNPRPATLAALTAALALLVPAAAQGSTVIGSDLSQPPNLSLMRGNDFTLSPFVYPGRTTQSPVGGIVTSFSVRGSAPDGRGFLIFRVLRASSGIGGFTVTQEAPPDFLSQADGDGVHTYKVRQSIEPGDYVGLTAEAGTTFRIYRQQAQGFQTYDFNDDSFTKGNTRIGALTQDQEVLLQATIEPDTDGDGFGDETQDECLDNPKQQHNCFANLSVNPKDKPDPVTKGGLVTYTVGVRNGGSSASTNTSLGVKLGKGLVYQSATTPQGTCTPGGKGTVTCDVGKVTRTQIVPVKIVARASKAAVAQSIFQVSGDLRDPNLKNNRKAIKTHVH